MNILIRLDISKSVGTGHFRRMLNLSKLKPNFNFTFIVLTDDLNNDIFDKLKVKFISKNLTFEHYLQTEIYDLVIMDLLKYPKGFIKNIKLLISKPLITFHEYNDYSDYSDLIINYNFIDITNGMINNEKYLIGPKYIILSDEIESYKHSNKEDYIFVSFGGSDPSGLTAMFVNKVALYLPHINFKIHIGNFNQNIKIKAPNIEYLYRPNNLFEYMSKAKKAITAAGNMMYELLYFNIPTIVVSHNQHQHQFAFNAVKKNYFIYLGLAENINYEEFISIVSHKYAYSSDIDIIDNYGKYRIFSSIERLLDENSVN